MTRPVRDSHLAWGIILGYELGARDGELLSQAFGQRHRVLSTVWIFYTAAHCAALLPPQVDVYHLGALVMRRGVRHLIRRIP